MKQMLSSIKAAIKKIVFSIIKPPYVPAFYSQAGEDVIVAFLFRDYGLKRFTYLDLGTNKPDFGNNTYKFYCEGATGVCVEADSTLIHQIKKIRPKDKIIHAGVSTEDSKEANFYVFNEPSLNTFDKVEAEYRACHGKYKIVRVEKVSLININELINSHFDTYPDFISIDIEGLDLEVLKSLNYKKYPIPVICVETCKYSENHIRPKNFVIADFLQSKGYEIYADTYINTIFVNKEWFYSK
jgi:FkbM family methyltransferase